MGIFQAVSKVSRSLQAIVKGSSNSRVAAHATPRPARRRTPAQRPGAVAHDELSISLEDFSDGCNLSDDASVGALVPSREGSVTQATLEQEEVAKTVFGKLLAAMHGNNEAMMDVDGFRATLRDAENADLLNVWPFRGSQGFTTNLICSQYNVGDLVHAASHQQRLHCILPQLETLLYTARSIQPRNSQCLTDTLTLLGEAYDKEELRSESKARIARIMNQWGLMKVPVMNNVVVWSDEPQVARIGSRKTDTLLLGVGYLAQQRPYSSNLAPSAAVQPSYQTQLGALAVFQTATAASLPASPEVQSPAELAPVAPQEIADIVAEAVAVAVAEAVRTVTKERDEAFAKVATVSKVAEDKAMVIRALLHRPNDKYMVREYCRRHTNTFLKDFNAEMLEKCKQRKEAESLRSTDTTDTVDAFPFTSMLASVEEDGDDDLYV